MSARVQIWERTTDEWRLSSSAFEDKDNFVNYVLMIGFDLNSTGGIASVVKSYINAHVASKYNFEYILLRTNYYQQRGKLHKLNIFVFSIFKCFYYLIFKNVQIVHLQSSYGSSFARKSVFLLLSKYLFRKKCILHIHSGRFEEFFINNKFSSFFLRKLLRVPDLIIVLCKSWEIELNKKYKNLVTTTLANPVKMPMREGFPKAEYQDERVFRVLFLGFLIPLKGLHDIISVSKLILESNFNNIEIIIGGKGDLAEELAALVNKYSLNEIVHFTGWVDGVEKEDLLKSSSMFFLPSYIEGMPISILEAMSYGLPIVSTRIAGIPEIVIEGNNGYLFEPGDVPGFFEAIVTLSNDRELCNQLGRNSFESSSLYSNEVIFNKLVILYSALTNGRVGSAFQ